MYPVPLILNGGAAPTETRKVCLLLGVSFMSIVTFEVSCSCSYAGFCSCSCDVVVLAPVPALAVAPALPPVVALTLACALALTAPTPALTFALAPDLAPNLLIPKRPHSPDQGPTTSPWTSMDLWHLGVKPPKPMAISGCMELGFRV